MENKKQRALALAARGRSLRSISRELGVAFSTVWVWVHPEGEEIKKARNRADYQRRKAARAECQPR